MKKLISTFMIAALLICCFTATAFASSQTVLTTTVPDATYTLNIPANQEIEFGTVSQKLGNITVTDSSGFAEGKDVKVTCGHDMFINEATETTIPYSLSLEFESMSGSAISGSDGTHNLTTGVFFILKRWHSEIGSILFKQLWRRIIQS